MGRLFLSLLLLGTAAAQAAPAVSGAPAAPWPTPSPCPVPCTSGSACSTPWAPAAISPSARDLALEAQKWNLFVDVKSYTDERVATEDFKAGQCQGVAITTLRTKQFNRMVGSIDSPGNLPDYAHVKTLLKTLSTPTPEALRSSNCRRRLRATRWRPISSCRSRASRARSASATAWSSR